MNLMRLNDFVKPLDIVPFFEDTSLSPKANVWEEGDKVIAEVECAGISPKDIDVSISGNVLTVRGEKKSENTEERQGYHVYERSFGKFLRTFTLPTFVTSLDATARNGVIRVEMKKSDSSQKVEVRELSD